MSHHLPIDPITHAHPDSSPSPSQEKPDAGLTSHDDHKLNSSVGDSSSDSDDVQLEKRFGMRNEFVRLVCRLMDEMNARAER